ncbi:hypothetical protein NC652_012980 [Populus alba x Populus x berolinensis]|nr:hypothetical protein NC652_012980 [Populus alba x Populus x berolinensis]
MIETQSNNKKYSLRKRHRIDWKSFPSSASKEVRNKQSEIPQLFNLTIMMFTRKNAFRATASDFRNVQQHMEMGIFPSFLFFNHHHISTSACTKKPSLPHKNGGFVSNNSTNISIDDALASFYRMVRVNPRPSVAEFGKFIGSFAKKKQYSTVVSLCNHMDLFGVTHNVYSLSALINCLCRLNHVDFAVSILGKMVKLGIQPNVITFNTLLNGVCMEGKIKEAEELFNEMVRQGHEPDVITPC